MYTTVFWICIHCGTATLNQLHMPYFRQWSFFVVKTKFTLCAIGRYINCYGLWKTVRRFSKATIWLSNPSSRYCPKEVKFVCQRHLPSCAHYSAIQTAKTWNNQPKGLLMDKWIKNVVYIHNGLLLRFKKEMHHFLQHGWTQDIMLREISQMQKRQDRMLLLVYRI